MRFFDVQITRDFTLTTLPPHYYSRTKAHSILVTYRIFWGITTCRRRKVVWLPYVYNTTRASVFLPISCSMESQIGQKPLLSIPVVQTGAQDLNCSYDKQ